MAADKGARAVVAVEAPPRIKPSNYPPFFAVQVAGRTKRTLGDLFGLKNFGVNHTTLAPGAISALLHRHSRQDEFVYVIEGELVLITDQGEVDLKPGMCAGFPAGGLAHQIVNRSDRPAAYLEIGDRTTGDEAEYPADDLKAVATPTGWTFTRKDGTPY
jgi:uncharacterized cupin superfamily protein